MKRGKEGVKEKALFGIEKVPFQERKSIAR
jgi:hypothetical protein